jgi:hypothetical protein
MSESKCPRSKRLALKLVATVCGLCFAWFFAYGPEVLAGLFFLPWIGLVCVLERSA